MGEGAVVVRQRTDSPVATAALVAVRFVRLMSHPAFGFAALVMALRLRSGSFDEASLALALAALVVVALLERHRARLVFLDFAGRGFLHVLSGRLSTSGMEAIAPGLPVSRWANLIHIGARDEQLLLMSEHLRMADNTDTILESWTLELETGSGGWVTGAAPVRDDQRFRLRIRSAAKWPR